MRANVERMAVSRLSAVSILVRDYTSCHNSKFLGIFVTSIAPDRTDAAVLQPADSYRVRSPHDTAMAYAI